MKEKIKNELKERNHTIDLVIDSLKVVATTTLGIVCLTVIAVQLTIGW